MLWESTGTCRTPCARHILWRYASRSVPCCGPLRVPRLRVVCPRALPFAAALLPSFSPLPARAPAPTSTRFVVPSAASPGGPQRFAGAHCSLPQVAWTTTTRHTPSHSHRCSRANLATCATFSRKACARLLLQLVPRSHSSVFSARVLPFLPICTWHVDFPGPLSQAPINSPAVRSIRSVGGDTHNLIDGAIYTVGDAGPAHPGRFTPQLLALCDYDGLVPAVLPVHCSHQVTLSYQDANGNPTANKTHYGVRYDITTVPPRLLMPEPDMAISTPDGSFRHVTPWC